MSWFTSLIFGNRGSAQAIDNRLFDNDLVEELEQRQLLAGNVSVSVAANGNVRITGDAADNHIEFAKDGNGGLYVVGEGDTTVNGLQTFSLGSSEIERQLIINTRGGDDHIDVRDVLISHNFVINSGPGDDMIVISETYCRDLIVNSAMGSDFVALNENVVLGRLSVGMGGGDDFVFVDACNRVLESVRIATSGGDDVIFIGAANIAGGFNLTTSSGSDTVVFRDFNTVSSFTVRTGSGDDEIIVDGTPPTANELFHGGAGEDVYLAAESEPRPDMRSFEVETYVPVVDSSAVRQVLREELIARGVNPLELRCSIIIP